jgi:hypothetical protein
MVWKGGALLSFGARSLPFQTIANTVELAGSGAEEMNGSDEGCRVEDHTSFRRNDRVEKDDVLYATLFLVSVIVAGGISRSLRLVRRWPRVLVTAWVNARCEPISTTIRLPRVNAV